MLMDFKSLPKVELHLHFDCSLSYAVISRLSPQLRLKITAMISSRQPNAQTWPQYSPGPPIVLR
jgi:hypothetical protein